MTMPTRRRLKKRTAFNLIVTIDSVWITLTDRKVLLSICARWKKAPFLYKKIFSLFPSFSFNLACI